MALANEQRHGEWLPSPVDLSFASEQGSGPSSSGRAVAERPFEVGVFTYLAAELRSGDICIQGSDCAQLEDPRDAGGLRPQGLRPWLATTAERVDADYPSDSRVAISEKCEPVLKRRPRRSLSASAEVPPPNLCWMVLKCHL